jgi:hypothetical protein
MIIGGSGAVRGEGIGRKRRVIMRWIQSVEPE